MGIFDELGKSGKSEGDNFHIKPNRNKEVREHKTPNNSDDGNLTNIPTSGATVRGDTGSGSNDTGSNSPGGDWSGAATALAANGETGQGSTTPPETTLGRQPATAGSSTLTELAVAGSPAAPLSDTGAGAGSSTLSELGAVTTVLPTDLTQPPSTTQPQNNPYGSTSAIPNPGQETFNNYISQGNLGGALSNSLFSPYAQAQNSLEAVSKTDALLNNTTFNGQTQTFGNITPTDIQPLYTAIDNNTGNIAFLNLNRDTSLTVTDINGINILKSDVSNPVLTNHLTPPSVTPPEVTLPSVTIPDINASISQTTSNTVSTTIDSIGLTPLGNPNNTLNQPLPSNNNQLNAGLEAAYSTQSVPIVKTGIESNVILNPNLISANINNNEIANAAERTSLTFSSANPNQPPLAATPLMNNLINALNITPKSPLTNLSDALNITSQRPLTGLNTSLPITTDISPLSTTNISGLSPLSPNNIANTMHNLVENTVNFILGRPNDFVNASTGIDALSAQPNSNLFTILVGLANLNNNPNAAIADARFDQMIRNMNTTKSTNTSDNGSAVTSDLSGIPQIILPNLKNIENQNDLTITIKNLQLPHDLQQLLLIDKLTNVKDLHSGIKININSKDHQLAILKALNTILNPNEKNDQLNPLSKVFEHLFKDSNKNKLEELKILIEKQLGRNLNNSHEFDKPYLKDKTRTTLLLSELLTASLINKNNVLKDTSNNFKQFVNLLLTKLEQKHNNVNNTKFTTSQKALNILTKTFNTNELALKNTLKMFSTNFENLLSAKLSNRQIPGRLALENSNMANHDFTNLFLLNLKNTQGRLFTDKTLPNENRAQHLGMDFKASMSLFVSLLMESMASSIKNSRGKVETDDDINNLTDYNFDALKNIMRKLEEDEEIDEDPILDAETMEVVNDTELEMLKEETKIETTIDTIAPKNEEENNSMRDTHEIMPNEVANNIKESLKLISQNLYGASKYHDLIFEINKNNNVFKLEKTGTTLKISNFKPGLIIELPFKSERIAVDRQPELH